MAGDAVGEIKSRLDIVEVIGGYMRLAKAGREHKGLCPFHGEKTPSFTVSQERQVWYCFGCQAGGDLFAFVQRMENVDFRQALELLAERAGVEIESGPHKPKSASKSKRIIELNTRAAAYFTHVLWQTDAGMPGRMLLEKRGITRDTAEKFGIGFAPAGGAGEDALVRYLRGKMATSDAELADAGLAHYARGGRLRDRFRHRLIFPIADDRGQIIAFGARALGSDIPKYLNSPETAAYQKSNAIFGYHLAKPEIVATKTVVLVEGYFDVIACHLAGVGNVVASSGTALTKEQVTRLSRIAETVVLCFDGDDAGRAAASRAVDLVAATGLGARVVRLPDGCKDPDEVLQRDPTALAAAVNSAPAEWQHLLDEALGGAEGEGVEGRRTAAERVAQLLNRIPQSATRQLYLQQAARRLGLSEASLSSDLARHVRGRSVPTRLRVVAPAPAPVVPAAPPIPAEHVPEWERCIARLVLQRPSLAQEMTGTAGLDAELIGSAAVRTLLGVALEQGGDVPLEMQQLPPELQEMAAGLLVQTAPELEENDPAILAQAIRDYVGLVREAHALKQMRFLQQEMALARDRGDQETVRSMAVKLAALAAESPRLRRSAGTV